MSEHLDFTNATTELTDDQLLQIETGVRIFGTLGLKTQTEWGPARQEPEDSRGEMIDRLPVDLENE